VEKDGRLVGTCERKEQTLEAESLSSLKDELSADLMGGANERRVVQFLGVEGETSRHLNTGAEGLGIAKNEKACGVNLCLDEGSSIEVCLSTNFKADVARGRLGIVDGLGTSLNVAADAVVVRSREGAHVPETVEGNSVFRSTVAKSSSVTGNASLGNVVSAFSTEKETVTTEDRVSGERRALEDIKEGTGVETGLLVDGVQDGVFGAFVGVESRVDLKFEALGDLVLDLNGTLENVGRRPGFGEGEAVLGVDVLGLQVTVDVLGLGVARASNLESDV